MNWEHLKTYIWVRWRLSVNQVKRSGSIGAAIAAILTGLRILGGGVMFLAGFLVGLLALSGVEPKVLMVVWDGVAAGFIFFWMVGLLSELQRTELLSFSNFMHLPVSPSGAFLINYVASSFGLSLILFLPAMLGLTLGLTLSRGPAMLFLLPLVAAFFLMITAVTHQFRGWLAGMMTNPRRRRTVVAVVSLVFILIFQIPNIATNLNPKVRQFRQARREALKEISVLDKQLAAGQITQREHDVQAADKLAVPKPENNGGSGKLYENTRLVNLLVPPGWLPYGAESASQGRFLPVAACVFGMSLIGIASLRRSYRTTIRLYTGDFTKGKAVRARRISPVHEPASEAKAVPERSAAFLEKKLPGLSEYASAVTLAGIRSLLRSTEAKMMLLTPVIMLIVFGSVFFGNRGAIPAVFRPLSAIGFAAFIMIIGLTGFMGNVFAFDRDGFRAFVLSGAARREILLGKNLSFLPIALALMAVIIGLSQWLYPMPPDQLAAVLVQTIPIYLLFCLAGNTLSILSPMTLKQNSGKPAQHQGIRALFQFIFMLVVPIPIGCTLIPWGIEALFSFLGWMKGFPLFLILGLIQAVFVVWLYRKVLDSQGNLLLQNEKKILEVVSQKGE